MSAGRRHHPAIPYTVPFAAFLAFLAIDKYLPFGAQWNCVLRFTIIFGLLVSFSLGVIEWRFSNFWSSTALGVAVFVIWLGPDLLWPSYRQHWLFSNGIVGAPASSLPAGVRNSVIFIIFRTLSSVINVPVLEELFWRGWLMRWLILRNFTKVPLGAYSRQSFWIVAVLFASEHGSYWDVGLIAGILFNWWIIRTKSLADCILAHAVTNACLAAFVVMKNQWQYWL